MKILILNPPSPDKSYINRDQMGGMGQKISFGRNLGSRLLSKLKGGFIHTPVMQLVYAATILSDKHDVKVIDALNTGGSLKSVLHKIKAFKPNYVIMATSSSGILYERDVVAKEIKSTANCKIITVGDTIPNLPHLMKEPLDISISGEIEKKIVDICDGKDLSKINGILYRKNKGVVVRKKDSFLNNKEMEKLPFPKWELFPYKQYTYYPLIMKEPVASLLSSRGCPYSCHYCSYSKNMGLRWRARSAKNVVDEIERNIKKYGFRGIFFRDPLFSLNMKRVEKVCHLLIKKRLKIQFVFETRPELLSKKLLNKLYKAGCTGINIGIEDINPKILENIGRKPVDLNRVEETIKYAERIGIRITCFFILGLPRSNKESTKKTINFSLKLNPSYVEYKIATPYPGTILYKNAKKNKWLLSENYEKFGGYSSVMRVNKEIPPEYLEKTSSKAFEKFYLRPGYILREIVRGSFLKKIYIVVKTLFR